ncbi:hypothetical protein TNCV_335921 [Trichonephila clavipes]|nr:hypothetical protein TNCV_335921 [Trichonephila clavipes]
MLQSYHQEVTKAGENVELLLVKLNVPLFRIPASEKELDKIILRVKSRISDPPAEKNNEAKKPAAVSPPPPPHPVQRVERRNGASMLTASLPQATSMKSSLSPLDPRKGKDSCLRHVSVRSQLLAPHTNSCVQASVLVAPFRYCYQLL